LVENIGILSFYFCNVDLWGIIGTNVIFQRNGQIKKYWFEKKLDAFEQVFQNLVKYNPDYPMAEKIGSLSFAGDENPECLKDKNKKNKLFHILFGIAMICEQNRNDAF